MKKFIIFLFAFYMIVLGTQKYSGGVVSFKPEAGEYEIGLKVEFIVKPFITFYGAKIDTEVFYTINGSVPDKTSLRYKGKIFLNKPGEFVISARAFPKMKGEPGKVYSARYVIARHGDKKAITDHPPVAEESKTSTHKPVNSNRTHRDGYSVVFSGDAFLSEVLLFDMGCLVLKFTHPLSHHRETVMKGKAVSANGDVRIIFDTEYRSWKQGNHMVWSVVFTKQGIPKDVRFISDSGTFKTGRFYNRIKGNIINGLKGIVAKTRR